MGTTKEVSVYLKTVEIGNFEYLNITNTTSSGGLVTVKFSKQFEQGNSVDCETGEFGRIRTVKVTLYVLILVGESEKQPWQQI